MIVIIGVIFAALLLIGFAFGEDAARYVAQGAVALVILAVIGVAVLLATHK